MIARASQWSAAEVARAVGGALSGPEDLQLTSVSTDTRDALSHSLFVALVGERFDAHDFLDRALDGGASALLVSRDVAAPPGVAVIRVEDTLFALGELARAHRARMNTRVIGLTGSNGKTTTKEMLGAILQVGWRTLKTEGNLNNLIGVPMTVLGATPEHEVAVIEMGMNTPGEIGRYTEIADPDVGLVINVGPAHIGRLGSMQAIAEAKGELYAGLRPDAIAVVNADDPWVVKVASVVPRRVTFGRDRGEVRLLDVVSTEGGQRISVSVDGDRIEGTIPFEGAHNAMNATAAIAAAHALGAPLEWAAQGLPNAARVARRLSFEAVGPYLVVDDCYNANAASMAAAIETVAARAKREGRRFVALLGEMRELGTFSDQQHEAVGRLAAQHAQVVASFGPLAKPIGGHHEPEDADALYVWLKAELMDGDVILVKGSRGIRMEQFVERLREEVG